MFGLHEDELVAITERSSLMRDPRLARAIARAFAARLAAPGSPPRERLMREIAKRTRRLTPFVEFSALSDVELERHLAVLLADAEAALTGTAQSSALSAPAAAPSPSPGVHASTPAMRRPEMPTPVEIEAVALEIAARTGFVSAGSLGEAFVDLPSEVAERALIRLAALRRLRRAPTSAGPPRYTIPPQVAVTNPATSRERGVIRRLLGGP